MRAYLTSPKQRAVLALEAGEQIAAASEQRVDAVEGADLLGLDVLGRGGADDVPRHPAVERRHPARSQRALDVAEQDDPRHVGLVLGGVNEGLVEEHVLAVAPGVRLAVDEDAAVVGIRRDQPEVIAQRAGERIAVAVELAAGRQQREHRRVDRRQRLDQRHRFRAQRPRRRQRRAVPLEVEALPAFLEEGIEAEVVVAGGGANLSLAHQRERLVAHHLPVVAKRRELRQHRHVDERLRRHRREQVHEGVVRRHDRRVVLELPDQGVPDAAAKMHVQRGRDEHVHDDELRREQRPQGLRQDELLFRPPAGVQSRRRAHRPTNGSALIILRAARPLHAPAVAARCRYNGAARCATAMTIATPTLDELKRRARAAAQHAYAPYSGFAVGAAVLAANGDDSRRRQRRERLVRPVDLRRTQRRLSGGRARRAQHRRRSSLYTPTPTAATPCGACRQVLHEFGPEALIVCCTDDAAAERRYSLAELLPDAFRLESTDGRR